MDVEDKQNKSRYTVTGTSRSIIVVLYVFFPFPTTVTWLAGSVSILSVFVISIYSPSSTTYYLD